MRPIGTVARGSLQQWGSRCDMAFGNSVWNVRQAALDEANSCERTGFVFDNGRRHGVGKPYIAIAPASFYFDLNISRYDGDEFRTDITTWPNIDYIFHWYVADNRPLPHLTQAGSKFWRQSRGHFKLCTDLAASARLRVSFR